MNTDAWIAFYQEGGSLMHVILGLGVLGLAIVIERCWQLYGGQRLDVRRLMDTVQRRLFAGDMAGALRSCPAGRSVVVHIVRAGLMAGVDPQRTEAAIREERLYLEPRLRKRLLTLGAIANLAMLVGLLGTIFGMIQGFSSCTFVVSAEARAASLAHGIGIAIHTTGFGILVGIVLLSARLMLAHACEKLVADVAVCGARVVNLIRIIREPARATGIPYR